MCNISEENVSESLSSELKIQELSLYPRTRFGAVQRFYQEQVLY